MDIQGLPRELSSQDCLPMQETPETQIWSLCQEDPLEEKAIAHSNILAGKTAMDRGAWQPTLRGVTKSQTQLRTPHGYMQRPPHPGLEPSLKVKYC